jgi:hypothetical protein
MCEPGSVLMTIEVPAISTSSNRCLKRNITFINTSNDASDTEEAYSPSSTSSSSSSSEDDSSDDMSPSSKSSSEDFEDEEEEEELEHKQKSRKWHHVYSKATIAVDENDAASILIDLGRLISSAQKVCLPCEDNVQFVGMESS